MNKEQLQNLLNQKYDAANWNKIYGSIFPNVMLFASPKEIAVTENWVKSFKQRGLVRLQGNQDVAIFEVVLQDGISVQSKRVGLRNLVAKLIDEYQNHGVLAVFDNGSPEYRFTFAAKETKVTREGIEKTETDSKRYTYILGETETCKTAAEQFIKLSEKGSTISLSDLQEAFSVEKLSKQFFNEYKEQYTYFVSYLASQPKILKSIFADEEKRMRDFVKLLLGRLVFLQFVQKKRWLGVPSKNTDWSSGDVKFLVNTYKAFSKKEKYYSEFLEELFFECLNSPNRKNELFLITGTKVPFLNGGLFENDNPKTKSINFPTSYFDGLFDFFGRYNFTIDENDPTEKEVGIDPEMLGSIFENLLEDNKDKGAFYTPKEIVHYMCQESLIEYLCTKVNSENDENIAVSVRNLITKRKIDEHITSLIKPIAIALREVKICDPAIGSGAFPMGMLMEIFHCVFELYNADPKVVSKEWNMNGWQANVVKSNIIQNSIYGVDIEKGAVDIARLRFWLSLIVDEEEPKALPNLDYKIVVGNSLVSKLGDEIIDIDWEVKANTEAAKNLQQEIQDNLNKLYKTQKVFFDFNGKKENLKEEIRNLKIDVLISQLQLDKYKYGNSSAQIGSLFEMTAKERNADQFRKQKLTQFDKTILELEKLKININRPLDFFDWKLDFPEVLNELINSNAGFDIVIGNPPYIQLQKDGGKLAVMFQDGGFETFERTGDIYSLFYEKGYQLLKNYGNLCFITSNKWMRAGYGKSTRKFLSEKSNPLLLIDFAGQKIFESATVDVNILQFSKDKNKGSTLACQAKENALGKLSVYVRQQGSKLKFLSDESWTILSPMEQNIKKKIEFHGKPLKKWKIQINYGIKTGFNEAFVIDKMKMEELVMKDPNCVEIIRPILRGRDVKRYGYEFANLYLISTFPSKKIDIEKYPAIKKHLLSFGLYRLEQTGRKHLINGETVKARKKTTNKWFETQDSISYWDDFFRPKIIYPNMTKYLPFVYDENNFLTNQKCFIITGENVEFLTAFFNSSLFKYCFRDNFPELLGGTRELSKIFFDKIPIIEIDQRINAKFKSKIILIQEYVKNKLPTRKLEIEIDEMIFDLYNLTKEERETIGFIEIQ